MESKEINRSYDAPIFIVGFTAVGKTTIGKCLAERLQKRFIDTDEYIQWKYHNSIGTMMMECGIEKFRKREKVILLELSQQQGCIISTGGGMACWSDNMDTMLQKGLVIYLESTPVLLAERLYLVRDSRPLVRGMSREEVEQYIAHTLPKRLPFYQKAHCTIPVQQLETEADLLAVVDQVVECLSHLSPDYRQIPSPSRS